MNDWEVLIAAQHHGLPTRLLDWTYSPMVAAHFATLEGAPDVDRAIWRLDWKAVHRFFRLPERALLIQDLEGVLGQDRPFTPWALFEPRTRERDFVCMIEPPSLDARITSQAATFTLCSDNRRPFDVFLEAIGLRSALTRFVIPARDARRLRDQLDMVSVDERQALSRSRRPRRLPPALLLLTAGARPPAGQPSRRPLLQVARPGEQVLEITPRCGDPAQSHEVVRGPGTGRGAVGNLDLPRGSVFQREVPPALLDRPDIESDGPGNGAAEGVGVAGGRSGLPPGRQGERRPG